MEIVRDLVSKRFFSKAIKSAGCWGWNAGLVTGGYTSLTTTWGSSGHVASYVLHKGPIPPGMQVDHLCSNPVCTNPDHLDVVTRDQDAARKKIRNRWRGWNDLCKRGHELNDHTTQWRANGKGRQCRVCQRARQSEHAVRNGKTPHALGNRPNGSLQYKHLYLLTAADYEAANLTLEFLEVFWACDSMIRHGDRETQAKAA